MRDLCQCECERGGDCTKITMCAVQLIVEELERQNKSIIMNLSSSSRRGLHFRIQELKEELEEQESQQRTTRKLLEHAEESNVELQAHIAEFERQSRDRCRHDADRIKQLKILLKVAKCPNALCSDGSIPHGPTPDGDWEAEQCQWCCEREAAIKGVDDE